MNSQEFDYEVLDLGLVLYKNIIENPAEVIEKVNSIDKRFMSGEHGTAMTEVRPWIDWSDNNMTFCHQKFFQKPETLNKQDFYYDDQYSVSERLYSALDKATEHYTKVLYPFADQNIKNREYSIHLLRYDVGGHLPAHQDHGVSSRVLSTVSYLNDDYEGGEIEFRNSNVKIKPPAGSIIFFPSNFLYVHEVYPITSGSRYSLPHWFHNMKSMVNSTGEE